MIAPVLPTYNRAPLAFVSGQGSWLTAEDGRRYLDLGSGIAVNALGHAHPALVATLTAQAQKLWHVSNVYTIPEQERLAHLLVDQTFADTVFFTNSGVEALECAIKVVRKYHDDTGNPGRYRIITCAGAFHGRSLATLAAGRQEKYLKGFEPMVEGFDQVALNDLEAVKKVGPIEKVYPGHGPAGGPEVLATDAAYIQEFLKATPKGAKKEAAMKTMQAKYPSYALPIILDLAVSARLAP